LQGQFTLLLNKAGRFVTNELGISQYAFINIKGRPGKVKILERREDSHP
jgi:hypothetical protein